MHETEKDNLAKYRLQRAEECLSEADTLLADGHFNGSVSRSYYAIFNGIRAVLALDGMDFKKHSAVISYFQKEYVKCGLFSSDISDIIKISFSARHDSDYGDFCQMTAETTQTHLDSARKLVDTVKKYIHSLDKVAPV